MYCDSNAQPQGLSFEQYILCVCVSVFEYVLGPMQHFLRLWGSPTMCVAMHSTGLKFVQFEKDFDSTHNIFLHSTCPVSS